MNTAERRLLINHGAIFITQPAFNPLLPEQLFSQKQVGRVDFRAGSYQLTAPDRLTDKEIEELENTLRHLFYKLPND